MKKFKRITALTLCAAMILTAGSCNQGGRRNTEQGADNTQLMFDVFDGPVATDSSYTQLLGEHYNTIEATLNEYRSELKE